MPNTDVSQSLSAARKSLSHLTPFDEFFAALTTKDRVNVERRLAALDATGDRGRADLWKRLASTLMTLAPHAVKITGKQTVQFYIADGKYRMQVFALEDIQDGIMTVYCPDIIAQATGAGVLSTAPGPEPHVHFIEGSPELLRIEPLDKHSGNPATHFKDLVGWNRKALRITLPPSASKLQLGTAELLCAIAALHFRSVSPPDDTRAQA